MRAPLPLHWTDTEDIACALFEREPEINPLQVRFPDLRDKVMALPGFQGSREHCNERVLEAIQMAWLEEYQDRR